MPNNQRFEKKFWDILEDMFTGAEVEGKSGYVNLLKIKRKYFNSFREQLKEEIDKILIPFPKFREELYTKLYSFFHRYFSESGSIYFSYTPLHYEIYEKVYDNKLKPVETYDHNYERILSDKEDVTLFWKTHMLYYIKTDRIIKSLSVEIDNYKFFFDASDVEQKKSNEKRQLIYRFQKIKNDNTILLNVLYSEHGSKTKIDDILNKCRILNLSEETLKKTIRTFEKQTNIDYFINKDAKKFLTEQFNLWLYQYVFYDEADKGLDEKRINELNTLRKIAFRIINIISQFEEELKNIWNKPRFILNSNYVITLDRIHDINIIEKIIEHENFNKQIAEWKDLGIVNDSFDKEKILYNSQSGKSLNTQYNHVPIDTKYFKDIEIDIISLFDNLDKVLDGWLIHSENYQALNTILPKFKKKVQTIYIDPPFNTGSDFDYIDKFQDSTWLTLMENRIDLSKNILHESGSFFLHLDHNANYLGRILSNNIFDKNFVNEIIWRIGWVSGYKTQVDAFVRNHDTIFFYSKGEKNKLLFNKRYSKIPYKSFNIDTIKNEINKVIAEWNINKDFIRNIKLNIKDYSGNVYKLGLKTKVGKYNIEDTWNCSEYEELNSNKIKRNAAEYTPNGSELTQKPEELLKRVIELTTNKLDIVMDFFAGSGTTVAVAKKLERKFICIEQANYFYSDILPRMKEIISGKKVGISKMIDYKGGGFFKYYNMEQYEEILRKVVYKDIEIPKEFLKNAELNKSLKNIFIFDSKLLNAVEIESDEKVKVDLSKLYPDVDIAETISCLTGKWIKRITKDSIEFENMDKPIDPKNLDYKLIKSLIWW